MSIDSINSAATSGTSGTSGTTGTTTKKNTSNSDLSMEDFFQLMVAQLSNQDMYNTVDNNEYINQMAQFSMIQAISDLSKQSVASYSVNLIGKEVAISQKDSTGATSTIKGIVEGVTVFNGESQIVVDGKNYELSSVVAVKQPNIIVPKTKDNGSDSSTK